MSLFRQAHAEPASHAASHPPPAGDANSECQQLLPFIAGQRDNAMTMIAKLQSNVIAEQQQAARLAAYWAAYIRRR
jgi:hypothetical protein